MPPIEITPEQTTVAIPVPVFTVESPTPEATILAGMATSETGAPEVALLEIPEVYYLHRGEFPWCLARRFDIDPQQILWLNGFFPGQVFYGGQPVHLPQNPIPFPGQRALRPHPAVYSAGYGDTIYSVACFFGDLDPLALAAANGLEPPYRLQPGRILTIP